MHRYNLFGTPAKSRGFQMSKIAPPDGGAADWPHWKLVQSSDFR